MTKKKRSKAYNTLADLEKEFGPRSVGRVLKSFREADDTSQAEFARTLGISRANLCDIEKGRKQVSLERAAKFARILGLPDALLVQYAIDEQLRAANLKLRVTIQAA
jgi:transcriptional regulator with XRE-family HTH domain